MKTNPLKFDKNACILFVNQLIPLHGSQIHYFNSQSVQIIIRRLWNKPFAFVKINFPEMLEKNVLLNTRILTYIFGECFHIFIYKCDVSRRIIFCSLVSYNCVTIFLVAVNWLAIHSAADLLSAFFMWCFVF